VAERLLASLVVLAETTPVYELAFAPRPALWDYLDELG
jgi:hypothetical protein